MNSDNNDSPLTKIDQKLQAVGEAMRPAPPWFSVWVKLTPASTGRERLAVYQAIRRSGTLPDEASFFLVSSLIDDIALEDADDALHDYERRLKAIESQYRLGQGGIWPRDAAPAGYANLRRQYYRAWGGLFARKLEQFGEYEMARMFRDDEEQFDKRADAGREYFFGPELPDIWLRGLAEAVAECIMADDAMGPLDYQHFEDEGFWHLEIHPTAVELIGGAEDGAIVAPGFALDIEMLRSLFERIEYMTWESLGIGGGDGPSLYVEGVYQGHPVFVSVLGYAPENEEPGMKLDTRRM